MNKLKQNENISKIINAFEHLQIQLALGIAESKETFDEQKKNISNAIKKLESSLTIEKSYDELSSLLKLEIEKFKIKLEILNLQYRLKKVNVEQNFETKKTEFISKIEEIKNRIIKKENSGKSKWENFQGEIAESFSQARWRADAPPARLVTRLPSRPRGARCEPARQEIADQKSRQGASSRPWL